jgi:hypothetical protein
MLRSSSLPSPACSPSDPHPCRLQVDAGEAGGKKKRPSALGRLLAGKSRGQGLSPLSLSLDAGAATGSPTSPRWPMRSPMMSPMRGKGKQGGFGEEVGGMRCAVLCSSAVVL